MWRCRGQPRSRTGSSQGSPGQPASQGRPVRRAASRQQKLSTTESGVFSMTNGRGGEERDLFSLIMSLKSDLNKGMDDIHSSLDSMNTKFNEMSATCKDLKLENEKLRQSNTAMHTQLERLEMNVEYLDGQSCRNNMFFDGCSGLRDEQIDITENKVRQVLSDEIHVPNWESISIEKVQRCRGGTDIAPTILVRFSYYKDKAVVLQCARSNLTRNSTYSVSEDFTPRVRKHRYELGKRMVEARNNNQYAVVRYDKLIIDDSVYRTVSHHVVKHMVVFTNSRALLRQGITANHIAQRCGISLRVIRTRPITVERVMRAEMHTATTTTAKSLTTTTTTTTKSPTILTTEKPSTTKESTTKYGQGIKCPTSWVRRDGSCYYFSTTLQSWASAKAYCNSHGADLVKIDNKAEQDYLVAVVSQFGMAGGQTSTIAPSTTTSRTTATTKLPSTTKLHTTSTTTSSSTTAATTSKASTTTTTQPTTRSTAPGADGVRGTPVPFPAGKVTIAAPGSATPPHLCTVELTVPEVLPATENATWEVVQSTALGVNGIRGTHVPFHVGKGKIAAHGSAALPHLYTAEVTVPEVLPDTKNATWEIARINMYCIITTVDGAWGHWSSWDSCSVSCGIGQNGRSRKCDSPAPMYGGTDCFGSASGHRECNLRNCPVDGAWEPWSSWEACSVSCGKGQTARHRNCNSPSPFYGGKDCSGSSIGHGECDMGSCPVDGAWGHWSSWDACSVSCGRGQNGRSRKCDSPAPAYGGSNCLGSSRAHRECNMGSCPGIAVNLSTTEPARDSSMRPGTVHLNAQLMELGLSGQDGDRVRARVKPEVSKGVARAQTRLQRMAAINVLDQLLIPHRLMAPGLIGQFGARVLARADPEVNKEVAHAHIRLRHMVARTVSDYLRILHHSMALGLIGRSGPRVLARADPEVNKEHEHAHILPLRMVASSVLDFLRKLHLDGAWSEWTVWGTCSHTCGSGVAQRSRSCENPPPANGGQNCLGPTTDFEAFDGAWSEWSVWSTCSRTCGYGSKQRSRVCANPPPVHGGQNCLGPATDFAPCAVDLKCLVDGAWSDWSDWDTCSTTCGVGIKQRNRTCANPPPANGGLDCFGIMTDRTWCSIQHDCPIPTTTPATSTVFGQETRCPKFWVVGDTSCYFFGLNRNWTSAKEYCNDHGADLVKIDDQVEQDFLVTKLQLWGMDVWWTGGRKTTSQLKFHWEWQGTIIPFSYQNWFPYGYTAGGDCVALQSSSEYKWTRRRCNDSIQWVCEKDQVESPPLVG
ncbi:HMCN1-like protein [Mya arenaria]|uniref:HMCN1-like protein n=1 Tax=Mya arenaria TaxID=6604 RepID=A0ABY7G7B7_MYAAR|nr:HMCN1-like protein [Mya arenaria]